MEASVPETYIRTIAQADSVTKTAVKIVTFSGSQFGTMMRTREELARAVKLLEDEGVSEWSCRVLMALKALPPYSLCFGIHHTDSSRVAHLCVYLCVIYRGSMKLSPPTCEQHQNAVELGRDLT